MSSENFFAFARARHEITLRRRAGLPRPWTDDAILGHYRFTNVFRELDRVTLWIDEHVRRPLDQMLERGEIELWQQVLGIVLARTFNRTETLEQIVLQNHLFDGDPPFWYYVRQGMYADQFEDYMRAHCPKPWVTGAYIVKTPDGMDKLRGALWIVERARERLPALGADASFACSMEALHADLVAMPYLGGFTAYEIVSDVRWLSVGRDWPDIMTWAHAGPGAIRGLHRVHGRWDVRRRKSMAGLRPPSQRQLLSEMRDLLAMSRQPEFWPQPVDHTGYVTSGFELPGLGVIPMTQQDWPSWEMREVEHTLCEFDKYERARLGQGTPRGVYR